MTRTRQWVAGTVVAAMLLLAAGWFLMIAPARSEAAELRASTESQQQANVQLVSRIEELKVQSEDLPAQLARLAELGITIPSDPQLPTLIRDLTAAAEASGALVVSIAPMTPTLLPSSVPVAVTAAPPETTSEATGEDTATGTDATDPAVVAAPPADPLYMIPLTVTLEGSYIELEQWLNRVEDLKRAHLVTGFSLKAEAASADPGADRDRGPMSLTVSTRVFMTTAQPPADPTVVVPVPATTPTGSDTPADTVPAPPTS